MAETTRIRWSQSTWNPVTGCTKVSPGCDHCYAERIAEQKRGTVAFPNGFDIQLRPHKIRDPIKWRDPRRIFVNSMSDLFHRDIPDDYLRDIWDTMLEADQHVYQILTKRSHRMAHKVRELGLEVPPHIWLGVSAENQAMADSRIPPLLDTGLAFPWVSAEPLIDAVDLSQYLGGPGPSLAWVVGGGESGAGRRPMDYDWARMLRDQCAAAGVPYFHKQGNHFRSDHDKVLDGKTHDEYPEYGPWRGDGTRTDSEAAYKPGPVEAQGVLI